MTPILLTISVLVAAAAPSDPVEHDWTRLSPRHVEIERRGNHTVLHDTWAELPENGAQLPDDWTDPTPRAPPSDRQFSRFPLFPPTHYFPSPARSDVVSQFHVAPAGLLQEERATVSVCQVRRLTDRSGVVTSPRYPRTYPRRVRCALTITAPQGSTIRLTCTDFRTQKCRFNRYLDYLLVSTDGQWQRGTTYVACGDLRRKVPFSITSVGPQLGLVFRSSYFWQYRGFRCRYEVQDGDAGGVGDDSCGVSSTTGDVRKWGRIVGGSRAEIEEYPWMAALAFTSGSGGYFCGGTIISAGWIMTAGHCTQGADSVTASLGGTLINSPLLSVTSTSLHTHPSYSLTSESVTNDIGLIGLRQPLTFSAQIRPICLPRQSVHVGVGFTGRSAQVSGWGMYSDGVVSISAYLRHVTVPVIANAECTWSPPSTQMCVDTAGGRGPCRGDSGGPLQLRQDDGTFLEIGIVSYGSSAGCQLGFDAGFTRVTEFLNYITSVTGIDLS